MEPFETHTFGVFVLPTNNDLVHVDVLLVCTCDSRDTKRWLTEGTSMLQHRQFYFVGCYHGHCVKLRKLNLNTTRRMCTIGFYL